MVQSLLVFVIIYVAVRSFVPSFVRVRCEYGRERELKGDVVLFVFCVLFYFSLSIIYCCGCICVCVCVQQIEIGTPPHNQRNVHLCCWCCCCECLYCTVEFPFIIFFFFSSVTDGNLFFVTFRRSCRRRFLKVTKKETIDAANRLTVREKNPLSIGVVRIINRGNGERRIYVEWYQVPVVYFFLIEVRSTTRYFERST